MKMTKMPATNIALIRAEIVYVVYFKALIFEFFYMLFSDKTPNKKAGLEQTIIHKLCFMHYAVQVNFYGFDINPLSKKIF